MSGIEVDVMLKGQEHRLSEAIELVDQNNEKRVKAQSTSFNAELKDLKVVARERHVLFVQDLKKVREDINMKIEELCEDMAKEIAALEHNYSSLHKKVDIIVDVVTNYVTLYESLLLKVDKKVEANVKSFGNIDNLLVELKGLVLKSSFVSYSLITP